MTLALDTLTCSDIPEVEPSIHSRPVTRHWQKPVRKVVYTLNIGNYEPRICELTYPLMRAYAEKIGAEFQVIKERKFPDWPIVYEKLQIHELGKKNGADWNIFIDSDALVSPEFFDITEHLPKDTVCHNGKDMAGIRWKYDQYFRRDGRHWGSCDWFTIGSDWCLDMWRPLDDLTLEEAVKNISITVEEHNSGQCKTEHLIDDYTLSRNIARFGLKATTVMDICGNLGWRDPHGHGFNRFLYHMYTLTEEEKLNRMLLVLSTPNGEPAIDRARMQQFQAQGIDPNTAAQKSMVGTGWGLMAHESAKALREKWGLNR